MKSYYRSFLFIYGLIHLGLGLEALIVPEYFSQALDIELLSLSAVNEIRAYYGGVFFVLGISLFYFAFTLKQPLFILLVLGCWALGAIFGRLVSILIDGFPNDFILIIWLIEWGMLFGSLFFYYHFKNNH